MVLQEGKTSPTHGHAQSQLRENHKGALTSSWCRARPLHPQHSRPNSTQPRRVSPSGRDFRFRRPRRWCPIPILQCRLHRRRRRRPRRPHPLASPLCEALRGSLRKASQFQVKPCQRTKRPCGNTRRGGRSRRYKVSGVNGALSGPFLESNEWNVSAEGSGIALLLGVL